MNPFTKLIPIVLAGTIVACGTRTDEPVTREPRPDPSALIDLDTAREFVMPPAPDPRLNRRQLNDLVRESPCDILPEYGSRVGSLAHGQGYPRWNPADMEIQYDSGNAEVANTPDPSVVHALTGGTTFENEVHDCQRLVLMEGGSAVFGPLVGIFPIDVSMHMPDAVFSIAPIPAATVYNWGDFDGQPERYARLGIEHEWNCLWLYNAGHDRWRAAITSDVAGPCLHHTQPTTFPLDVLRLQHRSGTPRTARLGWDERSGVQLLGVKCGRAWCWVGPGGLWQDDARLLTGDAHTTVPGWFDEQHLDIPGTAGTDPVVPGPYAVVAPTQQFHDAAARQHGSVDDEMTRFFRERPVIAQIDLPGFRGTIPPTYATKWGSRELPVRLRIAVPQSGSDPWPNAMSTFLRPDGRVGRSVAPIRVNGTAHAALGAVRWRWHDTDSTVSVWSPCGVGGKDCCDTR